MHNLRFGNDMVEEWVETSEEEALGLYTVIKYDSS